MQTEQQEEVRFFPDQQPLRALVVTNNLQCSNKKLIENDRSKFERD
jgi:hypothetical protein